MRVLMVTKVRGRLRKVSRVIYGIFSLFLATAYITIACATNEPDEKRHDCSQDIDYIVIGQNGDVYLSGSATGKNNVKRGFALKYNAEGDMLWSLFSHEHFGRRAHYGNGGFHLGGELGHLITAAVINDEGQFVWDDKHDPGFSDKDRQMVSVVALGLSQDGGTILVSKIGDVYDGTFGFVLYKYDPDGQIVASEYIPGDGQLAVIDIIGNVWIRDTNDILKYNGFLEHMWTSDIAETNGIDMMEPTENGDLYFVAFGPSTDAPWMRVGKLDPTGLLVWSTEFDRGSGYQSLIAGDNEQVYVVTARKMLCLDFEGNIIGEADVDTYGSRIFGRMSVDGVGDMVITGRDGVGQTDDIFVEKYSPEGQLLWSSIYDSDGDDFGVGIAFDQNDNIIITGACKRASCTIKFDSDGNLLWSTTYDVDADFCGVDKEDEEKACGG
jgi:hypothetical protein